MCPDWRPVAVGLVELVACIVLTEIQQSNLIGHAIDCHHSLGHLLRSYISKLAAGMEGTFYSALKANIASPCLGSKPQSGAYPTRVPHMVNKHPHPTDTKSNPEKNGGLLHDLLCKPKHMRHLRDLFQVMMSTLLFQLV